MAGTLEVYLSTVNNNLSTIMKRLTGVTVILAGIGAVAGVMRDRGIELIDSTALLTPLLAEAGVMTARQPTDAETASLTFGYRMADTIAGLDIGQTIAVKHSAVVAVEAMEGTDAVIARAAE